ncbi:class II histocompatibility antigen, B-L beta chain-like isoform X2 [Seriola aureovittata]|uniref:class II histocompatibility antigen, B-L beta chain-like isoform X2 n=1 Tax=Seriola aureovittata TaxID=2871759 RepID=UPI0024BDA7AF|nr:class II histocompatibility antigen, B-L beta chain-like isoform X2 [Seriola aureovittata]
MSVPHLSPTAAHQSSFVLVVSSSWDNMQIHFLFLWLFVVFSLFSPVFLDGNYSQFQACCIFNDRDFEEVEYIVTNLYNKKLMMEFNSTRGNWTGFTAYSMEIVKNRNNPLDRIQREFEKKVLCTDNIGFIQKFDEITVASPTIKLKSVKKSSNRHPAMLVCSAYHFYPKQIRVTWLQNGQAMTSEISSSDVLPDGDWYYQIHSYMAYTPSPGEKITCMVEHLGLSEPALEVWEPSLPVVEWIKIVVGLCGMMLGFVIVSSGFIYYKKKSAAYMTLRQGQCLRQTSLQLD